MEEETEQEATKRVYEQFVKDQIEVLNSALEDVSSDLRVHLLPIEKP